MTLSLARKAKLGTLHALKRGAALDDDTYRDKLHAVTGQRSAKDCSDAQLDKAIAAFQPKASVFHGNQNANNAYTRKLVALYLAAANLGAFDSVTDAAIAAFVKRQTGKEALRFLTPGEANSVSEALKAMCERHGFIVPSGDEGGIEARRALLRAQWKRLGELGQVMKAEDALGAWLSRAVLGFRGSEQHLTPEQADQVAKRFGRWIRKAQQERPGP